MKWILIGIGVIVVIWYVKAVFKTRRDSQCPDCKQYYALEFVKKEVVKEEKCSTLEKHNIKNNKGEVIGSTEQRVYGIKRYIKNTYQCKYCKQFHYKETTECEY